MPILTDTERLSTTIAGGKYTLDAILGRGGMGTVFDARHTWTGRRVAIKLLRHDLATNEGASERYLQEARAATAIEHPNVVEVLDMGRDDETTVYMVFEFLRGESLADRLDAVGRLPQMEAAMILLPVADALAAAHRLGIVHRDIKPDNIFLEDDGMGCIRPKLLDFGIARTSDQPSGRTHTSVVTGTPEYMSPEHAQGYRATPASDVWSLGVLLFECLTGTTPFHGESPVNVLMAVVNGPIPSLLNHSHVAPSVADVVERALVRTPLVRLPDAAAFRDALAAAVDVTCVPSRSRSVPPKFFGTSGELELTSERAVVARRSNPSLATPPFVPSTATPSMQAVGAVPSGEHRLDAATPARSSADDPREQTPTLDDLPRAHEVRRKRRSIQLGAALVLACALVALGWWQSRPEDVRTTPATPSSLASVEPSTSATPPAAPQPSLPVPSATLPGASVQPPAAMPSAEATPSLDSSRPRPTQSPRRATPAIAPQAVTSTVAAARDERRPPRATPQSATRTPQRGANGSLILD